MASTYLTHTPSSTGNRRTWTMSVWMKISANTESINIMGCGGSSDQNHIQIETDKLTVRHYNGSANDIRLNSVRSFRDNNAWYHLVVRMDTTQSTEADRLRIYINGEQITQFNSPTYPSQNYDWDFMHNGVTQYIGRQGHSNGNHWNGLLSHFHWCDGYSYAPTEFGETDSTTGEWKIKTDVSVNYGTNGFLILKDGNTITDQSSNSNDWSLGAGTLTKTEDNPSNVFCTMNPLDKSSSLNLSYGNTRTASPSNSWMPCKGTIGMIGQNGKFYWEGKCESGTNHYFGVYDASGAVRGSVQSDMDANRFVYVYHGGMERTITGQSAIASGTYATFANNDIIGVALDKENGTITFYKNGTQIYTETHSSLQTKDLIPGTQAYGSDIQWNFGNGYFGTTAVSSAGTNASGNGIFEYDVPSGYTALSTKGLNT